MSEHRPGMGAIVHPDGTAFRVWAPHADTVNVFGDFNGWDMMAHQLISEGNGYWYTDVAEARPGHQYKYHLTNGDQELDRVDPYARQVTNSVGDGIIYNHGDFDWEGVEYHLPSFNDLIIYELHVGSFVDADGRVGNFDDVIGRLNHLVKLGINVIELMPVMEFAGDSSWGYNPAHPFAIESAYGGPDGLKRLVREAHRRGIGVIADVVYNHFGPSDLSLWQFDGWNQDGKGGIYFYNDWRSTTPWGNTRPDYGRAEVRNYIRDNAFMWLRDYRIDGLRYDMTPFISSVAGSERDIPDGWAMMRWINESIRTEFPGRLLIAEDLHSDSAITSDEADGALFHAQWDAKFVHPIRAAVINPDDGSRSSLAVADAVQHRFGLDAFGRVIYTESHDEVANGRARVPQEVDPGDPDGYYAQKRSTAGAALVFTSPGIPMIFQGQEFLTGEWFRDDVPLDWQDREDFRGIVHLYRDLARLRRNWRDTTEGLRGQYCQILHANESPDVLAFHRWSEGGPGDDVVVVANLSHSEWGMYQIGMPAAGLWRLELNSDARLYSPHFGDSPAHDVDAHNEPYDGQPAWAEVSLGPYSVLIYSRA